MAKVSKAQLDSVLRSLRMAGWQLQEGGAGPAKPAQKTLFTANMYAALGSANEMLRDAVLEWQGAQGAYLQVAFAKRQIVVKIRLRAEKGSLICYADRAGASDLCRIIKSLEILRDNGYVAEPSFALTSTAGWESIYTQQKQDDTKAVFWNAQSHEDCFSDEGDLIDDLPLQWAGDPVIIESALSRTGLEVTAPANTRGTFYISPLGEEDV